MTLNDRAFTLIELLAVMVIVSLVVGTVAVSLASADRAAQLLKTVGSLREMDCRGRLHARTSGETAILSIDREQHAIRLVSERGESLASAAFDRDFGVGLQTASGAMKVVFDRQGRSEDYQFTIGTDGQEQQWRVAGLTGFIHQEFPR